MMDLNDFINLLKIKGIKEKEYSSLADLAYDVSSGKYDDLFTSYGSFARYDDGVSQNIPYITVYSDNKDILKQILNIKDVCLLDDNAPLFFHSRLYFDSFCDDIINFDSDYQLKEDEEFYIEIDPNDHIYSFIKGKLTKFCKDNNVKLHISSINDSGVVCFFDINENGDLVSNVNIMGGKLHVETYLYLVFQLSLMFNSLDDLNECNLKIGDIELIKDSK